MESILIISQKPKLNINQTSAISYFLAMNN